MGPLHESAQEDPEEEAAIRARQLEGMRRENYGFRKVEVRAGNIGYCVQGERTMSLSAGRPKP